MDQAVVVGNCQAAALEMMLSTNDELTKRFELVRFPPVHEIPEAMVGELHRAVEGASLVVLQQIQEDYRDGIGLGTETLASIAGTATTVRWPSVYWAGYFPDLFYLRDATGQPVVDGPFDYHDRTILQAYASGLDILSTCVLMEDSERPSDALEWAAEATAELDLRGQNCDVQITTFIDSRFRDELLFFTMNHPSNRMLGFIAQQITELVEISGEVDYGRIPDEILGLTFYPLHANHVQALGLEFGPTVVAGSTPFRLRGMTYEPREAVQAFFDYYTERPELVELNLEHVQRDAGQLPKGGSRVHASPPIVGARRPERRRWLHLPENRDAGHAVKPVPYLAIYEQLLAPLRTQQFTLLELGVWHGHSLQMWRDAFPEATIVGVDLMPPDLDLGPRVNIIQGDQTDVALMGRLRKEYAPEGFGVIIDDASHIGIATARSLQVLYEHVCPGGLYCIEDWGTGYLPAWHDGGQLSSPLDVGHLDDSTASMPAEGVTPIPMPSHDIGVVGLVKRLIDHTASGTVQFAQPDVVGDALAIESMTVWDGIVALRKGRS